MCRMATPQTPWGRKTWILLQRGWDSTRLRFDEPALCPPALSPAPGGWEGPKPQRETGRSKHQPCGKMKQRRKIESREQYRRWGRAVPCGTPRDVSGAPSPCETSLTCPFAAFLGVSPHPRNCFAFGGVFGVFPPGSLEMPQSRGHRRGTSGTPAPAATSTSPRYFVLECRNVLLFQLLPWNPPPQESNFVFQTLCKPRISLGSVLQLWQRRE